MEFKVIFAGFALHCVLNAVLIGKSVVMDGFDKADAGISAQQEKAMMESLADGEGEMHRISEDSAMADARVLETER